MSDILTIKLPVYKSESDPGGFKNISDYISLVKQNFRNLMLTNPGERMMDPDFGVGIKRYLFENNTVELREKLSMQIKSQTAKYMSFIDILAISFGETREDENFLQIDIYYKIIPLGVEELFSVA